ncbi:MAG: pentapeptide repeat-containing protein [Candidatus Amoebophilus sp.]
MKSTYPLFQQYIAYILLLSFFLQSCGGLDSSIIPMGEEKAPQIQAYTQSIVGQTVTAEGGHIVAFREEDRRIVADVSVNAPQGFSKSYEGVDVYIEQGSELSKLPRLEAKAQERHIHLQLAQGQKPARIVIYKGPGLAGGMEVKKDKEQKEYYVTQVEAQGDIDKIRKGLRLETTFQEILLSHLPEGYKLGAAYDDGDCFFDALAQWVNIIKDTDVNDAKYLRTLCHEFYLQNKELVDSWNRSDYGGIAQGEDEYSMVQYTSEECERDFHGRPPIWGRPSIEGQMLCKKLKLEGILSIEVLKDPETGNPVISSHLNTQNEYRSSIDEKERKDLIESGNIPIIINVQDKLHFVPLLKVQLDHTPVQLEKGNQLARVVIYKGAGLTGGMLEGEKDGSRILIAGDRSALLSPSVAGNIEDSNNLEDLERLKDTHHCPGGKLIGCKLNGCKLAGSNLENANLTQADLRGANLRGANLRGTRLQGVNLYGADLREVQGINAVQIKNLGLLQTPGRIYKLHKGTVQIDLRNYNERDIGYFEQAHQYEAAIRYFALGYLHEIYGEARLALDFYQKAAQEGSPEALNNLG